MAYEGWLRFGGVEVVNNERTRGIASTATCPMHWIKGPRCSTLRDALGDGPYDSSNLPAAPWFDASLPDVSSRFFGAFALSVAGLNDSTRFASVVESIDDGGTIGRTRKTSRQVRVRAMLLARGRDALDYGVSWLNAALDPDACGQHGTGCGTTDLEYLTDCPPPRGTVPDITPWAPVAVNLYDNPEMVAGAGTVEVRRNAFTDPLYTKATVGAGTPYSLNQRVNASLPAVGWLRVERNASGGAARLLGSTVYPPGLTAGQKVTISGLRRLPNGPISTGGTAPGSLWLTFRDAADAAVGPENSSPVDLTTAGEAYFSMTLTVPAGATGFNFAYHSGGAVGEVVDWSQPLVEVASERLPFFAPGKPSPDADLTPVWTGAANASPSVLQGLPVARVLSEATSVSYKSSGPLGRLVVRTSSANYSRVRLLVSGTGPRTTMLNLASALPRRVYVETGGGAFTPVDLPGGGVVVPFLVESSWINSFIYIGNRPDVPAADRDIPFGISEVGVFAGSYDGPWFSGDSVDGELDRYSWSGAPDASSSVHETRAHYDRPRTDAEYAALVDPFRRFLHNVSVISGPLEREIVNVGEFWGQVFEWTYAAGRPWVYSATRAVDLPITPTVVIEDTPYNLVPYPSAELAGSEVDAAYNFATNPSVETNATGWSAGASGGITPAMLTSGRVTGELSAVGSSSFRVVFTATGAGTNGSFYAQQEWLDISTRPAGSRVSINFWAAELLMSGAPVRSDIEFTAFWSATSGGAILRTDVLGTAPVDGGSISVKSIAPPPGANFVLVRARATLPSWPAGTVVRLYADALAVTVP